MSGTSAIHKPSSVTPGKIQSNQFLYAAAAGTNTITATFTPTLSTLTTGMVLYIKIANTNTAAATFNPDGQGAANIVKGAGTALDSGDLVQNIIYQLVYDGSQWQVKGAVGSGVNGSGTANYVALWSDSDTLGSSKISQSSGQIVIEDGTDATKKIKFDVASITTATTRTWTFPDITDTFVGLTGTQTLTNKTLGNTNIFTIRADRFTLQDGTDTTKQFTFTLSNITTATTRSWFIPDTSDTFVGTGATQTLGAKTLTNSCVVTLKDNSFTLQDDADTTKQLVFQLSGITTATTRTLTVPDASDTIAVLAATQALTNKTYNGLTVTSTTGTFTLTNAKTLDVRNSVIMTATDSSTVAFGGGGTVVYTSNNLSVFAATTSAQLAGVISDETGSGLLVFATSPTLTTPIAAQIYGSSSASGTLTLTGTSNATAGFTYIGTSSKFSFDETNIYLGINAGTPASKLEINGGGVTTNIDGIRLRQPNVAHGMTGVTATDVYGQISWSSSTDGGLAVQGLTDTGATSAVLLVSSMGATTTTVAAFEIRARKKNGTSTQSLAATEIHSQLTNNGTVVQTTLASGFQFVGGATSPTAVLHLAAGAAAANSAPFKFTSGTNLTTAEAGAMEYDGTTLWFTNGGAQRQELMQAQQSRVATQFDKTSDTTLANVTGLTATLVAAKFYHFEAILYTTSANTGGVKFAIGGTATATAIIYEAIVDNAAAIAAETRATALATAVGGVTTVTAAYCRITGTIQVNAAGTLTVQFAQNASDVTASSVLVGSNFRVIQIV